MINAKWIWLDKEAGKDEYGEFVSTFSLEKKKGVGHIFLHVSDTFFRRFSLCRQRSSPSIFVRS